MICSGWCVPVLPATSTLPEVGRTSPASTCASVLLPQPDSPTMHSVCPRASVRVLDPAEPIAAGRKAHRQVLDRQKRGERGERGEIRVHAARSGAVWSQQATCRAGFPGTGGTVDKGDKGDKGGLSAHRAKTCGQRAAKLQPAGGTRKSGTLPASAGKRVLRVPCCGRAWSKAAV